MNAGINARTQHTQVTKKVPELRRPSPDHMSFCNRGPVRIHHTLHHPKPTPLWLTWSPPGWGHNEGSDLNQLISVSPESSRDLQSYVHSKGAQPEQSLGPRHPDHPKIGSAFSFPTATAKNGQHTSWCQQQGWDFTNQVARPRVGVGSWGPRSMAINSPALRSPPISFLPDSPDQARRGWPKAVA